MDAGRQGHGVYPNARIGPERFNSGLDLIDHPFAVIGVLQQNLRTAIHWQAISQMAEEKINLGLVGFHRRDLLSALGSRTDDRLDVEQVPEEAA